jgi:hypothetical protein
VERASLQAEFAQTPLCDVDAFTRALEAAFAAMVDAPPEPRTPIVIGTSASAPSGPR